MNPSASSARSSPVANVLLPEPLKPKSQITRAFWFRRRSFSTRETTRSKMG